jgi:hypothetical protein
MNTVGVLFYEQGWQVGIYSQLPVGMLLRITPTAFGARTPVSSFEQNGINSTVGILVVDPRPNRDDGKKNSSPSYYPTIRTTWEIILTMEASLVQSDESCSDPEETS